MSGGIRSLNQEGRDERRSYAEDLLHSAVATIASLGAGAIVMLPKSKSHWLYSDCREQNAPKKTLVLCADRGEYKPIIATVQSTSASRCSL
jgi:hypothetical protein